MFTNIIVDYLNRMLCDYFENVDTSQLDVSLWRGEAAFQNLRLKSDLLENFGLPFKISTGICGTLKLKIPWSAIFTSPIEVSLMNLYILVIPGTAAPISEEFKEKLKHEFKMKVVEGIQAAQLFQQQLRQSHNTAANELGHSDNRSYFEKLLLYLINNIQVEISSIHFRYEDLGFSRLSSKKKRTFSLGVILKKLSLETTDKNWVPGYISEHAYTHFKMASMEGFAIYWNSDNSEVCKMFFSDEDRCTSLHDIMNAEQRQLKFIIGPLSTQSQLTLTPSPETGPNPFSLPTVTVSVTIKELEVSLTSQQFQDAIYLIDKLDSLNRQQRWNKFKLPNITSYKGNYKYWWNFAYNCTLDKVRRKRLVWKWSRISEHRKICKEYHDVLCKKFALKSASLEIDSKLNSLERSLDAFNIILVRNQVTITLQKKAQRATELNKPATNAGWFSGWFSSGQNEHEEPLEFLVHELSSEEKSGLFEAIGYSEVAVPVIYPPDFVDFHLEFHLEYLRVIAKVEEESRNENILTLEVRKIKTFFSSRPVNSGMELKLFLGSIEILGIQNKAKILRCRLSHNFFEICYERFPLDTNADQRIFVKGLPLEIVYSWKTIQELVNCFRIPEELTSDILQVKAAKKFIEWKAYSRAGLQHILENRGKLEINLNLTAPNMVIPQNGEIRRARDILVFQLGSIIVYTKHPEKRESFGGITHPPGGIHPAVARQYYETFVVELRDFKVMIKVDGINKQLVKSGEILARIDQCVVTDDPRLPQIKIFTNLSLIDVEITELRLNHLINLLTTLPIPELPYPNIASSTDKNLEVSEFEALSRIAAMKVNKNKKLTTKLTVCVIQVKIESFKISVAIE